MEIFDFKHLFITQSYLDSQFDPQEINEQNDKKNKRETALINKDIGEL